MHPLRTATALVILALAAACGGGGAGPTPRWSRPPTPAAPSAGGPSFLEDPAAELTWLFSDGELLALYDNAGNTFIELWVDGVNLIGGFDPGQGGGNLGPARAGHGDGYPFGRLDAPQAGYGRWEGFWAGFNYVDARWLAWTGLNGNPEARRGFEVAAVAGGALDVHVTTEVARWDRPLFRCDVHYLVSRAGIGVRSQVEVLTELQPLGWDDTGGQLLMTQLDTDLDPALPYDRAQPSLYFALALDDQVQELDPYPPYNAITPSNIYADHKLDGAPEERVHLLPGEALVTTSAPVSTLTPLGRADRAASLALRIDRARSTLPPLEFYCELNGERDYLNYLYSAALGQNRDVQVVPAGTAWQLYGDLLPWSGADPSALAGRPLLSDPLP